ncbi:2-phospho-L-lactate guanylyltransferase [Longivirga aurantiaca]|uniref:Phosphoenolpyruvate guanylyltransferase n=1 Tax=Longivirga aurantiaca TaxID=1837743 RepID=A0ABW1SZV6_9ACTN
MPSPSSPLDWVVVAPVKRLDRAKTRLSGRPAPERRSLALAFAVDTVRAALACERVRSVVVASDDAEVRSAVSGLGARWVPDIEGAGLNELVEAVAAQLRLEQPDVALAALVADLPALRSDELRRALEAGGEVARGFVADAAGTGTTLLTARPGSDLGPRFGPRSRAAHAASGAVALEPGPAPGLRRDVDTEVDLWDAGRLGLGPATAALVHGD